MKSKNSWNTFKAAVAGVALLAGGVGATSFIPSAYAQEQSLSTNVAKEVNKAYTLVLEAGDNATNATYNEAIAIMRNIIATRGDRMKPYDKATVYELIGQFQLQLDPADLAGALRSLTTAIDTGALPATRERPLRFAVAQIFFSEERYQEAVSYLQTYIRDAKAAGEEPPANAYLLLASAYAQTDNFRSALSPAEEAVRLHEKGIAEGTTARRQQHFYTLLNSVYSSLQISDKRIRLLEKIITYWPDKATFWEQLAGLYSTVDDTAKAAAVLELAYKNGIITDGTRLKQLAQLYSGLDNPYRGAILLEREMAAGNIKRTQKNLELLAQLWSMSREQKKAAAALREAADMSPNGELYYRLGQALFLDEQYRQSEKTFQQALQRGGLTPKDRGNIWLLIGNARYNIDTNSPAQRASAKDAWRKAINTNGARKVDRDTARGWLDYVNAVERTECNQDSVERLVIIDNYKKEKSSCESNLNIVDRSGSGFSIGISEERIAECRRIVASEIDETSAIITYEDGEKQGTEVPGYCKK